MLNDFDKTVGARAAASLDHRHLNALFELVHRLCDDAYARQMYDVSYRFEEVLDAILRFEGRQAEIVPDFKSCRTHSLPSATKKPTQAATTKQEPVMTSSKMRSQITPANQRYYFGFQL